MENGTQPINTPVQTPQQPPVEPIKAEKPKLLLNFLVILEIITILVAVYFAFQFSQLKKQLAEVTPSPSPIPASLLPSTTPVASTVPNAEGTVTWKTGGIPMKAVTIEGGELRSWLLSYDIPTIWTFVTKTRENESCGSFVFTSSDKLLTLNMDIVCNGWSANYTPWPDNGVVVGTQYNRGNDGHTAYMIRYFDSSKNQYVYTDADATADVPLDKSKTPIDNAVIIGYKNNDYDSYFQVGMITLTYKGTEAQKNSYLEKADRIVNSLILK